MVFSFYKENSNVGNKTHVQRSEECPKGGASPKAKQIFAEMLEVFPAAMLIELKDAFKPSAPAMDRTITTPLSRHPQTATEPTAREPRLLANHPGNPTRAPNRPPGANVVRLEPDHFDRC